MTVLWPNGSTTIPHVTSEFGPRGTIPGVSSSLFHSGIDLIGFPINKSPAAGVVILASYNGAAGNEVRIRADNGDVFRMLHNARLLVSYGQRVDKGQDVGVMGTTGSSAGVHCHFETRPRGGAAVNPRDYMAQVNTGTAGDGTPIDTKGFLMALSEVQQQQIYDALVQQTGDGGGYYKTDAIISILRSEVEVAIAAIAAGGVAFPGAPYNAFVAIINAVRGAAGEAPIDVDETKLAAELAPALAPLIAENVGTLTDATVAGLVKKLLDEQARRQAE